MEHSKKIKRIDRLEQCLSHTKIKYEYAHELLRQLNSILKTQILILAKLESGAKDIDAMIKHLKLQFELEEVIITKINNIESFHNLFLRLVRGEHIVKTMDSSQKQLIEKMQNGINKIFSGEITEGITYEWAMTVFNEVQDIVMNHEAIIAKGYDPHEDVDFEFVNSPGTRFEDSEFVKIVKNSIINLRKRDVSNNMLEVFVHIFRDWYNYRRDDL